MQIELVSKLVGDYVVNSKYIYRYSEVKEALESERCKNIIKHFGGLPIYSIPEPMTFIFSLDKLTPDLIVGYCTKLDIENGYAEVTKSNTEFGKSFTEEQLNDCKLGFLAIAKKEDDQSKFAKYNHELYSVSYIYALQLLAKGRCL